MSSTQSGRTVTGEPYVEAIEAVESNRRARAAFHQLVVRHAKPGATILDFGAGPGIDALFYARAGYRVLAYDIDPQMCASLRIRCREYLERESVALIEAGYEEFLGSKAPAAVDIVASNFAPLSMIDDLERLFDRFAAMTRPGAKVIASVLNPNSLHDLRYGWWWRNRIAYLREGEFTLPGPGYRIHRRSVRALARRAAPEFQLTGVHRGLPTAPFLEHEPLRSLAMTAGGFVFVVFTRC